MQPAKRNLVISIICLVHVGLSLAASAATNEIRFVVNKATRTVIAQGYISANSDLRFKKSLASSGISEQQAANYTVMFHSSGGSVLGSIMLGVEIRKLGMATEVGRPRAIYGKKYVVEPGDCASACVWSFLGGFKRTLDTQDRLLIHRTRMKNDRWAVPAIEQFAREEAIQSLIAELMRYVKGMGVDTDIVAASLSVTSLDFRALRTEEIKKWNVVGEATTRGIPDLPVVRIVNRRRLNLVPERYKQKIPTRNSYHVFGVRQNDVLNMRSRPDPNSSIVGSIPPWGKGIQIIGGCQNSWCNVQYNRSQGYVSQRYIKPSQQNTPNGYRVVHVEPNDVLNLRSLPNVQAQILHRIEPNAYGVRLTGPCRGSWCPIIYKGQRGWVDGTYLQAY